MPEKGFEGKFEEQYQVEYKQQYEKEFRRQYEEKMRGQFPNGQMPGGMPSPEELQPQGDLPQNSLLGNILHVFRGLLMR